MVFTQRTEVSEKVLHGSSVEDHESLFPEHDVKVVESFNVTISSSDPKAISDVV